MSALTAAARGTYRIIQRQKKNIAKAAICTAAAGTMLCWWGNTISHRYERNQRVISAITTQRSAENLERIIVEQLDQLQRAGGSLRNHKTRLGSYLTPDAAHAEAAAIERDGESIFNQHIKPGITTITNLHHAPTPRTYMGKTQSEIMLHKMLMPFLIFAFAGALIAQTQLWYREMIESKRITAKVSRWCAMAGMISVMPYLPAAGVRAYREVRPVQNHYAPHFNEINATAGSSRVTTPQDIALALYHENIHFIQSRIEDQQFALNSIFIEGDARMREMDLARSLTASTGNQAYLESALSRAIPELTGVYLAACQISGRPANTAVLIRICREAGAHLNIDLDEHAAGTALYMIAARNAGKRITEMAAKRQYESIIESAERG